MSRDRSALVRRLEVGALAMLAGWITLLSWRALTVDFAAVAWPLLLLGALLTVGGSLARWCRVPAVLVLLCQLLLCAVVVVGATTGSLVPTAANLGDFTDAVRAALDSSRQYVAPIPASVPSVHPLLLIGGALLLLAIEVCAGTLRKVPLAGLALLVIHTVPSALTTTSVPWWTFIAGGGLFLAALFAQHSDELARWGHGAHDSDGNFSMRTGAVARSALALGSVAIALALAAPLAIPTLDTAVFDGPGPGARSITVKDPMVDLRRDLRRGQDVPLLWVSTSGPRPTYLRMAVLANFVDERWTPGDREIPEDQVAVGSLPGLDGVSTSLPRSTHRYGVRVSSDFDSTWLPTMPQITRINAGVDWRYDLATRDFIAAGEDVTAAARAYDFSGVELDYDPRSMDEAVSGITNVRSTFTDLPSSLPIEIRELATQVTQGAPTRYQKMQRLQQWFRQDGGFRYDIDAVDSVDEDGADLVSFLSEGGRVGYCEQFAASMAIMARVLGVPSRVAVGFLEPEGIDGGQWEFSAWDLHAWPELYFPGSGWVRFEPTPAARAGDVPAYTNTDVEAAPESPSPTSSSSTAVPAEPRPQPEDSSDTADEPLLGARGLTVLLVSLGLLLVAALLQLPRLRRGSLRRARLARGIEGVWEELQATAVDLGHTWPHGRSPRRTGAFLGSLLGTPSPARERPDRPRRGRLEAPLAAAALDRLVERLERSRYAPYAPEGSEAARGRLADDADLVMEALVSGVSGRVQRRAEWWPRSVVGSPWGRRPRQGPGVTGSTQVDPVATDRTEELVG
ncbi:transglutaminase domain-containing protein [Nocardioides seonyuensis]|uniref:Transglutaminase domain-containing protein n=1 Tax=Nocardioides seonyuensis TaxID=2518371 RepID=A0A4P7IBV3_9ACTN|nr:DUF3488 and transglutaminase-like domain-containing protein [Nocardioides seonyuensis]QBX54040.1 transglutaminase domain-containing protein [Nocardioides seonyuensis]